MGLENLDTVLHCVVLDDSGKGLWKYKDGNELLDAMYMALEAHHAIHRKGFLHRDINAANILIRARAEYRARDSKGDEYLELQDLPIAEGFLTDFELASFPIDDPTTKTAGETMTGTALFMATELLEAVVEGRTITRTVEHDIESFGWVFLYVLYVRALLDMPKGPKRTALQAEFRHIFATNGIEELKNKRLAVISPNDLQLTFKNITCLETHLQTVEGQLADSLDACWELLHLCCMAIQRRPAKPKPTWYTKSKENSENWPPVYIPPVPKVTYDNMFVVFRSENKPQLKRKRGDTVVKREDETS